MASVVPAQFLFTADPAAPSIIGFKINSDGGLSPIPGSPFRTMDTPRQLFANGSTLVIAGDKGITASAVNKETGAISRSSSMSMQALSQLVARNGAGSGTVLDASGRFLYILDPARAEIAAFSVRDGQTVPLSPPAYRAAPGATSLAVVRP
jgi:6-phosphogluconolactonase (cycloisomerase 2 family)